MLPPVVPGEPLRISGSTFVAWKKCPETANARFRGLYGPDSRPAFVGGLAHKLFSRHFSGGPIADDEFAQACREEIGKSNLNHKMGGLGINMSALNGIIEEVRSLYQRFIRFPGEGFETAELELAHDAGGGLTLIGTVDAVFREELEGSRLVDWKTGSSLEDVDDQLSFYALLWVLERGEMPALLEAVSVSTGESHRARPSEVDIQRIADEVAAMASELRTAWLVQAGVERRAGPWCRYCPVLAECPEGQAVEAILA